MANTFYAGQTDYIDKLNSLALVLTAQLTYMGVWSAAGGTYPTLPTKGFYYKISASGTISGTAYVVGDTIIYNGTTWDRITQPDILPTASTTVLGGVKVDGTTITITNGVISAAITPTYTLPTASSTVLGGIKVGTGLTMASGVLSVSAGATVNLASPGPIGNTTPSTGKFTKLYFDDLDPLGASALNPFLNPLVYLDSLSINANVDNGIGSYGSIGLNTPGGGTFNFYTDGTLVGSISGGNGGAGGGLLLVTPGADFAGKITIRPGYTTVARFYDTYIRFSPNVQLDSTINNVTITDPINVGLGTLGSTLTIADGKTLTALNTITLSSTTDGVTLEVGSGGTLMSGAFADVYTLGPASATVLGGIKVGSGLSIDTDGVLSSSGGANTGSLATGILKNTTVTGALSIAVAGADYSAGTYALPTGLLKTQTSTGALSTATAGVDYTAGTSTLATGILKNTTSTGAHTIATAGVDYTAGTSTLATGILKNTTSTGAHTIASAGTDYGPPTATLATGILKNTTSTGAHTIAVAGTDYSAGTSALATGLLKSTTTSGALSIATAGVDYTAGTSTLATGILKNTTSTGAHSIATVGVDYGPGTSTLATGILKNTTSTGAHTIAVAGTDYLAPFASQTANTFYAAPNGSAGTPAFRAIVAADIPTLNQNTTGTAARTAGYALPDTGATSSYVYLGRWTTAPQSGAKIVIDITAASGYNASITQNQLTRIYFKTSNNSTSQAGSNGTFFGDGTAWRRGANSTAPSVVRVVQIDVNTYDFYGSFATFLGVNSFYQVNLVNGGWTHSGTIVATPAAPANFIDLAIYLQYDSSNIPIASSTVLGVVKSGSGISIDANGVISSTSSYSLPIATSTVLGGIKVGTGLSADANGVLSVSGSISGSVANFVATSVTSSVIKFDAGSSGATVNDYNYALGAANDTGTKLVVFVNSSTRTADGGVNATTIRNDGGKLILGAAGQALALVSNAISANTNITLTSGQIRFTTAAVDASGTTGIVGNANGWTRLDPNGNQFLITTNKATDVTVDRVVLLMQDTTDWNTKFSLSGGGNMILAGSLKSTAFTNAGVLGTGGANAKNHFTQPNAGNAAAATGWISAAFGDVNGQRAVIGQAHGYAYMGAHTAALDAWSPLFLQNDASTAVVAIGYPWNTAPDTAYRLKVNGAFAATTKSFLIDHPTKPGKQLRYGSLEGPENGVYIRGRLKHGHVINLPEYWTKLVDPDSITVNLTPIGVSKNLYVKHIGDNRVTVGGVGIIDCFYTIFAERIDVDKLVVEL